VHASGWGINDSDLECWIVGLACILIFLCPRMQFYMSHRLVLIFFFFIPFALCIFLACWFVTRCHNYTTHIFVFF
jgi:hypothetical protein